MTKEQKATVKKWIEALRSGKYDQTHGQLVHPTKGYCCLGVLCEIQGVPKVSENDSNYLVFTGEVQSATNISEKVMVGWTGITSDLGQLINKTLLMGANDREGLTFNEIADLLDIYLLESN